MEMVLVLMVVIAAVAPALVLVQVQATVPEQATVVTALTALSLMLLL